MKKLLMISALAALFCAALGAFVRADGEPYKKTIDSLNARLDQFKVPLNNWKYRQKCDETCFQAEIPADLKWKSAAPGMYWPEAFQVFWFRRNFTVPETVAGKSIAGSRIVFYMNVSDGGDLYVNGKKSEESVETGAVITGSAVPGEEILLGVRVHNGTWPGAYLSSHVKFSALDEIESRTRGYIEKVNSAESLISFSPEKQKWIDILNSSAAKIDLEAFNSFDEKKYYVSLDAANAELDGLEGLFREYTIYLTGYSHIDLAWLWDKAEGEIVTRNTLNTVFKLFEEYPDWVYTHSQAHGFKWMEDDYPEIYKNIQKYFKEGRLEIVGGTWSEHDSNLPDGEGFVRQFLYGKRYFRQKFGKDVTIAWTPDSFGYNWNLPQILVKSGMKGFLTQKLGSNEQTRFPYVVFWWQAPDGSKILTYFPPSGYANPVHRTEMIGYLSRIRALHNIKDTLVIFGVGDHGGGVTRGHLDRALEIKNDKAAPNVVFTTAEGYFDHLLDLSKTTEFPVWDDELYLEHHRGTYTTQANNKKNNRRCEQLLMDAEKLSLIASAGFGAEYPAKRLFDSGWYYVLFSHMHDILPGSGIRKVYEDSDKDYAIVYKTTNDIIRESLEKISSDINTDGPGEPVVVFNTLSWRRDAIVEQPLDGLTGKAQVLDPQGREIPCQVTEKDGKQSILFIARSLPAGGYSVYRVFPAGGAQAKTPAAKTVLASGADFMENDLLKLIFDPATGDLVSVYDKKLGREFLKGEKQSNMVQAFKDTQNAWEIQSSEPVPVSDAVVAGMVEKGPVRMTLKISRKIGESTVDKYVSLYESWPLVDGRIDLDWKDHNVTLKLAFFLNLLNDDAWFEIPYAAISRKAIPTTPAEKAKYEVSAHKWIDYTGKDGSAGISLLNSSKYGYDVKDNVMRMTLLRSPITPDPEADQGKHSISYALYTHAGDWRAADTSRRGHEFNYPPQVLVAEKHSGSLPAEKSFFAASADNAVITAVKKAEDGDGYVMRIVETEGRPGDVTIELPFEAKKAVEINLIEDEDANSSRFNIVDGKLTFKIGKFEIVSVKLKN